MTYATKRFHVPTPEEVRTIEMAARRAQAEEVLRLVGLGARGLKRLVVRAIHAFARLRHRPRTVARHGA